MALIECVPNVSEGRRSAVIAKLAGTVQDIRRVRLLDVSSDASHNRSVFTMAGEGAALQAAVVELFGTAIAAIDLRAHTGVHPRLGVVDVVPFVPLSGARMAECVALAHATGQAVAARFGVPVYLYEEAATRPERKNLENIRRGGFESLPHKMANVEWTPDFGPPAPHPTAGAAAIGARGPLIAFNVNLATDRLDIARTIAATVRFSGGGLPFVKAMGVSLSDRHVVQVSMNLTNYQQTSLRTAYEAVCREAQRHGVDILESEIVGLVPEAAVADVDPASLKLRDFDHSKILERRLAELG